MKKKWIVLAGAVVALGALVLAPPRDGDEALRMGASQDCR